ESIRNGYPLPVACLLYPVAPVAGSDLLQDLLEPRPCLLPRRLVGIDLVLGIFSGAHEPVPRAVVGHGLILLPGRLHPCLALGERGTDAGVVAGIEAVDRRQDLRHRGLVGADAVEDERGVELLPVGREAEGLAAAPAEAGDGELAVGRGE